VTVTRFAAALILLLVVVVSGVTIAQTGAPLPRFAALRADEVNLRAGPGTEYPVEWVFLRRALPIEITAEYGQWRKIRDFDGSEGWVHKSLLTGRRSVLVTGEIRTLRNNPAPDAAPMARAEPGVIGRLLACADGWCEVEAAGHTGWLPIAHLWGVYDGEVVE
jgi:SH3-like domain-containing protein